MPARTSDVHAEWQCWTSIPIDQARGQAPGAIYCYNPLMGSRFLPVLSIFAAGLVHSVLPHGAFGAYDIAVRATITGAVAGVTALLFMRWTRSH